MTATHTAAVHSAVNERSKLVSRPTPKPTASQVLIDITAASINPVDWKIRDGVFPLGFPTITGSDAAGLVSEVGPDVKNFKTGERVYFQGILGKEDHCTFQEKVVLDENLVSKTPANITDEEASGIQLASMAAVVGLYDASGELEIKPAPWEKGGDKAGEGQAIVVLGGSSSVGQYAIQLARLSGFSRIITTSSTAHAERVTSLGAHVVLSRDSSPESFVEASGSLPLTGVFDAIGNDETARAGVALLQAKNRANGTPSHYVSVRPGFANEKHENPAVSHRGILGLGSDPKLAGVCLPFIQAISGEEGWVAKGLFRPNIMRKVPGGLKALDDALDLNKAGLSGEKVWIDPRE